MKRFYMLLMAAMMCCLMSAGNFNVTVPADAELFVGTKPIDPTKPANQQQIHYAAFVAITPESVTTDGDNKVYSFTLTSGSQYNYRTWKTGQLTQVGVFYYNDDASKCPVLTFDDASYAAMSPKFIDHDVNNNKKFNVANILLNINERNYLNMGIGDTLDLGAQRDWQLVNDVMANYFVEPDYHYTVYNLNGEEDQSVVRIDNANTTIDPWATLKAVGNGTAIVTVTYDAVQAYSYANTGVQSTFVGGENWSALWPENTGVFVVTVGQTASTVEANMLINQAYNAETMKLAGAYVDAEHDVFYYINNEKAANYTFTPNNAVAVEIMYPTIRTNDAIYNTGFQNVVKNEDNSYTLALKEGRNIVRLKDAAGNYTYQVLTAKHATREIQNLSHKDGYFYPGDKVTVQYNGLYHPANKMSGIYNMSAYITYNGKPTGTELVQTANQYNFAGTPAAQAVTLTLPTDGTENLALTEGVLQVTGFGDPIGNHRNTSREKGRFANFTAVSHKTYFGQLPDVNIRIEIADHYVTLASNVPDASIVLKSPSGDVLTPETDGRYHMTAYGVYKIEGTAAGYGNVYQNLQLVVSSDKNQTISLNFVAVDATNWDGTTTTEPTKVDDVYQISTGYELAWFAAQVNAGQNTIKGKLLNDIDLANFSWTPIGNSTAANQYAGVFDGDGHTVKNLYINSTATHQGLFGYVIGTVKNLTVAGQVTTTANYAGGVAAYAKSATITNCFNYATVSAKAGSAGIVGFATGAKDALTQISNCANYGDISVTTPATTTGGGCGIAHAGTAYVSYANVYNHGTISGPSYVAGIASMSLQGIGAVINGAYNVGVILSDDNSKCGAIVYSTNANAGNKASNVFVNRSYGLACKAGETEITNTDAWKNGEVAYKLAAATNNAFGQTLGEDAYPVLGGEAVLYDVIAKTYYNESNAPFQTRVLTFEDVDYKGGKNFAGGNNWTSLIDNPQYGGLLLYGESGMGVTEEKDAYTWTDEKNTGLSHMILNGWGSWAYWTGGHAISNYASGEADKYGDFNSQLTVYKAGVEGLARSGAGHDGSDNFAVHYGYTDNSGYSGTELPALRFQDGKERYVESMYITNTTYAIHVYCEGNGLSAKIGPEDWVKVLAIGYNAKGQVTDTASIYLCNGPENIIRDWTLFDLTKLGKVARIEFNVTGSSDNGSGFSQPAYFAYDDVAVRFYPEDYLIDPTPNVDVTGCVTFEDLNMDDNSFKNDILDFQSGDFYFSNYYNETYYSWNGFAPSTMAANTFTSYDDQYNNCVGGGMNSKTFAMGYYSEYNALMDDEYPAIYEKEYSLFTPEFVYVTNSANDVMSMLKGDAYAKKFTNEDYLKLIITGLDADFEEGESVEFYLAKDGEIVTGWQKIDLTKLGKVMMLQFTLESSDVSWGFINTPCYFAIDNFKAKVEKTGTDIQNIKVDTATKRVHNGQLYILRDGVIYNAQGVVIR